MSTIRCLAIDFDGVLVDSNAVKRSAYLDIFAGLGDTHAIVERCWNENRDGDRYQIIEHILQQLETAGVLDTNGRRSQFIAQYAALYNAICEAYTTTCPEIYGASVCLPRLALHYALYVNSATPEEPLRRVIQRRGWAVYFREILGRPRSKAENLLHIMQQERIDNTTIVFVGDRQGDLVAARTCGCYFVGMRYEDIDFIPEKLLLVDDWHQLEETLTNQWGDHDVC